MTQTITAKFQKMLLEAGEAHGFTAISAGFNTLCSVGNWWSVNVHWEGHSCDGIACASGSGDTIPEALKKAIAAAEAKRRPFDDTAKSERIERLRAELAELEAA